MRACSLISCGFFTSFSLLLRESGRGTVSKSSRPKLAISASERPALKISLFLKRFSFGWRFERNILFLF